MLAIALKLGDEEIEQWFPKLKRAKGAFGEATHDLEGFLVARYSNAFLRPEKAAQRLDRLRGSLDGRLSP